MSDPQWLDIGGVALDREPNWSTAGALRRCDPLLVWADTVSRPRPAPLPNVRMMPPSITEQPIGVLIELKEAGGIHWLLNELNLESSEGRPHFLPNGLEQLHKSCFITGLVDRVALAKLVTLVGADKIKRFTLQESRRDPAQQTTQSMGKLPSLDGLLQALAAPVETSAAAAAPRSPITTATSTATYLGIIDDGLPVFRLRSAIAPHGAAVQLWDQGWLPEHRLSRPPPPIDPPAADDPYWRQPHEDSTPTARGFYLGRRLKPLPAAQDIGVAPDAAFERDEYGFSRYFSPAPRRTHGAAVLGLMAPWLAEAQPRSQWHWPSHISGLAMVQLPTATVRDTSGGSLAMRLIDGLRFILWQEEANRGGSDQPARPIVANVSYGVHGGPHDGTSMFERAAVEMLNQNASLHLVLPVGNSARAGCHAGCVLKPAGKEGQGGNSRTLTLSVPPDNPRDSFVQIWLPADAQLRLTIRPPGSSQDYEISKGQAKVCVESVAPAAIDETASAQESIGRIGFGAVYAPEVAQGTNGTMILLAIGRTRAQFSDRDPGAETQGAGLLSATLEPRREVLGTPGLWELTLVNEGTAEATVDAWASRDDGPPDSAAGNRQAYFPDSCNPRVHLGNAAPESSLNGIASFTHERLHVVGAMRADDVLSEYSAAGKARPPGERQHPDVVAPADFSAALPGLRSTGFLSGAVDRINGTSAACAVYSRALAETLARDPGQLPKETRQAVDAPPEVRCTTERQPEADAALRGQDRRMPLPFDVWPATLIQRRSEDGGPSQAA